jgi:hypothetical protein
MPDCRCAMTNSQTFAGIGKALSCVLAVLFRSWSRHDETSLPTAASMRRFSLEKPWIGVWPPVDEKTKSPCQRGKDFNSSTAAGARGTSCAAFPFILSAGITQSALSKSNSRQVIPAVSRNLWPHKSNMRTSGAVGYPIGSTAFHSARISASFRTRGRTTLGPIISLGRIAAHGDAENKDPARWPT